MSETTPEAPEAYRYTPALAARIESHWQDRWEREGVFNAPNPSGTLADGTDVADRPHGRPDAPSGVRNPRSCRAGAAVTCGHANRAPAP